MDQVTRAQGVQAVKDRIPPRWLLSAREPSLLGPTLDCAWPVEEALWFGDLLRAIDEAERSAER